MMRNQLEAILKEELRVLALKTRDRDGLTQKEMAEELVMSDTSYSDIETGVNMCGTLTAVLLILKQEDPNKVLRQLEQKFKKLYNKEELPV